jgi:hypothetical protein
MDWQKELEEGRTVIRRDSSNPIVKEAIKNGHEFCGEELLSTRILSELYYIVKRIIDTDFDSENDYIYDASFDLMIEDAIFTGIPEANQILDKILSPTLSVADGEINNNFSNIDIESADKILDVIVQVTPTHIHSDRPYKKTFNLSHINNIRDVKRILIYKLCEEFTSVLKESRYSGYLIFNSTRIVDSKIHEDTLEEYLTGRGSAYLTISTRSLEIVSNNKFSFYVMVLYNGTSIQYFQINIKNKKYQAYERLVVEGFSDIRWNTPWLSIRVENHTLELLKNKIRLYEYRIKRVYHEILYIDEDDKVLLLTSPAY